MAGLSTTDTPMSDMFVSTGGLPSSLGGNTLPLDAGPTGAERDPQLYNPMNLAPSNMAPQQRPYSSAPMEWGLNAHSNSSDTRAAMDFTKQSNWTQQVVEELKDFLYILSRDGNLLYVSPSCKTLTGYELNHLVGKPILEFVHADDRATFSREFNDSAASGNSIRFHYRFKKLDGSYLIFEVHGHAHPMGETMSSEPQKGTPIVFLMVARPYPNKSTQLLDSFLDLKFEKDRLMRKIADLKKEEVESEAHQQWLQKQDNAQNITPDNTVSREDSSKALSEASTEFRTMLPFPAKSGRPTGTNQNSNDTAPNPGSDSTAEKVSRFDDDSYLLGIELMTGLRYCDGERSHGISTGDPSAVLIQSGTSVAVPGEREHRAGGNGDKKKKQKGPSDYICTDCGALASPEWRKGPNGPKTLCNACGCESTPEFHIYLFCYQ